MNEISFYLQDKMKTFDDLFGSGDLATPSSKEKLTKFVYNKDSDESDVEAKEVAK